MKDNVIYMNWYQITKLLKKLNPFLESRKLTPQKYKLVLKSRGGFIRVDSYNGTHPRIYQVPIPPARTAFTSFKDLNEPPVDFGYNRMAFELLSIDKDDTTLYYEEI